MSASSYTHISMRDLYISRKGIHKWDFPCRVVLHDIQSFVNKKFVPLFSKSLPFLPHPRVVYDPDASQS
jgi:hypothetical protein